MTSIPQKKSERELHELLEQADLLEYYDKFIEIGADNVQQLRDLTDEELGEVIDQVEMIRKPLHVKRFRKALEKWTGQKGTCDSGTSTRETATAACTEQAGQRVDERSTETADIRADMHHAIDRRDVAQVRECLQAEPQLKMWLDPLTEESAMYRAVTTNAFKAFGLLLSQKCKFKNAREGDCLQHLNPLQKSELARQRYFVAGYEGSYISVLKGRSTSLAECAGFQRILDDMYRSLDSNDLLKPVLKVASMAPHLSIRFDFERIHTQCMVGGYRTNLGMTEPEKQGVFIGATGLHGERTDAAERRTKEVEGTLVHELCHLALNLVYGNEGKPYLCTDESRKEHYAGILEDARGRQHGLHDILKWAFHGNDEAELIVRIPHILALCPTEGNTILEEQVPRLFQFFKQHVVEDMTQYIQDGCLGRETEDIREENGKLGRASSTEELGIEFVARLDDCVMRRDPPVVLVASNLTFLEVMVNDLVRSARVPYLFLETSQWGDRTYDILLGNKCSFLLLSCEGRENLRIILNLSKELHDVTGTKTILLTSKQNLQHCLQGIKESMLHDIKIYLDTVHNASFQNVTAKCKNKIIKRSRIALQSPNQQCFIKDILDIDSFSKTCQEETLLTLCREGVLFFGPELKELQEDVSECYINQKCSRSVEVDLRKIRERPKDDAFAFLGCSEETLQSSLPKGLSAKRMSILDSFEQIVLLEQNSDYDRLVATEHYKGKTVHLLEFHEGRYVWKKSNGALSHLPMTGIEIHSANFLLDVREKVLVVSGDPGSGKTVLATRLCTEIKKADEKAWVLYVSTYPKRQEAMKLLNEETGDINFNQFAKLCCVKTTGQEFELFQQTVTKGSPFHVWVIFDALDETLEMTRKYILEFTKVLAREKLLKILIFTRTICRNAIQDEMHLVPFDMAAFSKEEQDEFLQKYQKSLQNPMTDKKTFKSIVTCVKEKDSSLLGNPLILRMVAEVDQGEASDPHYRELVQSMYSSQDCFTLLSLYRLFVEYKYLLYRIEKKKEDRMRAANEDDDETLKPIFQSNHALLALKLLLPEDALKELVSESEYNDLKSKGRLIMAVKENKLKQGIILCLTNDAPHFVHHSFAEFFAADLIFKRVKEANARGDVGVARIISGLYGEPSYVGMLTFLDGFAAERHAIQSSIMNNDIVNVKAATEHTYSQDALERTPLHVAALHANQDILECLSINEVLTQEDMLGMTPLMYADKIHAWKRLDCLCARSAGCAIDWLNQLPTVVKNITTKREFHSSILSDAIYGRLNALLSVLLRVFCKNKMRSSEICIGSAPEYLRESVSSSEDAVHISMDVDHIRDNHQRTPLHISVLQGELNIVHTLLPYSSQNVRDAFGMTPLQGCIFHGYTDILRFLLPLASAQDWYIYENIYETSHKVAFSAVYLQNCDALQLLLPHFETPSSVKQYLFDESVLQGYTGVAKALLPHTDASGSCAHRATTNWHASIRSGCLDTVRLMIPYTDMHGRDKDIIDAVLMAVVGMASIYGNPTHTKPVPDDVQSENGNHPDIFIVKLLIIHSNIHSLNVDGQRVAEISVRCRIPLTAFKLLLPHLSVTSRTISQAMSTCYGTDAGEQDMLTYLIPYIPINARDENGVKTLYYCCIYRNLRAAKLLLPLTLCDVDSPITRTPLYVSVFLCIPDIVELLLPHSSKRSCGDTLAVAIHKGFVVMTKWFLPHVDVNDCTTGETTVWRKSVDRGDWTSVTLLLPYTGTLDSGISHDTPFLLNDRKGSRSALESSKADDEQNWNSRGGNDPIAIEVLKLLQLHSKLRDTDQTLLANTCLTDNRVTRLLCPHPSVSDVMSPHSSITSPCMSGLEFILFAANTEYQDILEYLIPYTPINAPVEDGLTPLLCCIACGNMTAAKLLLPLTVVDECRSIPLIGSVLQDNGDIVQLLLPHSLMRTCDAELITDAYTRHDDVTKLLLPHVCVNVATGKMTALRQSVKLGDWAQVQLILPYTATRDSDIRQESSLLVNACKEPTASQKSLNTEGERNSGMSATDVKIFKLLLLHSNLNVEDADRALPIDESIAIFDAGTLFCVQPSAKKLMFPHSSFTSYSEIGAETINSEEDVQSQIPYMPINTPDEDKLTPLLRCVRHGYLRAAKLLLPLTVVDEDRSEPLFLCVVEDKRDFLQMLLPHSLKRHSEIELINAVVRRYGDATKLLLPHVGVNTRTWSKTTELGDWTLVRLCLPYTRTRDSDVIRNTRVLVSACMRPVATPELSGPEYERNLEENVRDIKILKLLLLHFNFDIVDRPLTIDWRVTNNHVLKLLQPHSSMKKRRQKAVLRCIGFSVLLFSRFFDASFLLPWLYRLYTG
ncbi:uncharacterized protein LOC135379089 [Ornithodoros turicata]|uniref:uncharacterized protein LOC135379089 n=1 Tax=Ornithodoros turicata TaxID=34597 RepID=UPI0031397E67